MRLLEIFIKNPKCYLFEDQEDFFINDCEIEQVKYEDRSER